MNSQDDEGDTASLNDVTGTWLTEPLLTACLPW